MLEDKQVQLLAGEVFHIKAALCHLHITVQGQHRQGKCPGKIVGGEAQGLLVPVVDGVQHVLMDLL